MGFSDGGDLERRKTLCGEGILNLSMVRMGGVGFLQQFIGIRCQVYRGLSHVWEISQM